MPVYTYKCNDCKVIFDELVRKESQKIVCPRCGCRYSIKYPSRTAPPQFKGSGFYSTDYKKKTVDASTMTPEMADTL